MQTLSDVRKGDTYRTCPAASDTARTCSSDVSVGVPRSGSHGAAATDVGVVLALSLVGCADDSDGNGSTESYAAGEDLTEWVTTEEMASVLERVSSQFTGSPLGEEVVAESVDDEFWYRSGVPAGEQTEFFNGGWEVLLGPWSDERAMEGAQPDPGLPDGVEAAGPHMGGSYFMRGPLSDEILTIWINPPETLGSSDAAEARWRDLYFQVASMALVEMGWAE